MYPTSPRMQARAAGQQQQRQQQRQVNQQQQLDNRYFQEAIPVPRKARPPRGIFTFPLTVKSEQGRLSKMQCLDAMF